MLMSPEESLLILEFPPSHKTLCKLVFICHQLSLSSEVSGNRIKKCFPILRTVKSATVYQRALRVFETCLEMSLDRSPKGIRTRDRYLNRSWGVKVCTYLEIPERAGTVELDGAVWSDKVKW